MRYALKLMILYVCSAPELFFGVGGFYEEFPQTEDQEVIDLMAQSKQA